MEVSCVDKRGKVKYATCCPVAGGYGSRAWTEAENAYRIGGNAKECKGADPEDKDCYDMLGRTAGKEDDTLICKGAGEIPWSYRLYSKPSKSCPRRFHPIDGSGWIKNWQWVPEFSIKYFQDSIMSNRDCGLMPYAPGYQSKCGAVPDCNPKEPGIQDYAPRN
jgi:hypothetical protein